MRVGCCAVLDSAQERVADPWFLVSVVMANNYVAPARHADAYHCPHCGVYAHQAWSKLQVILDGQWQTTEPPTALARCRRCRRDSFWHGDAMIYPPVVTAPPSHPDLPAVPLASYEEARQVVGVSARAGAALVRLALQQLLPELGATSDNLNHAVGQLVAEGLPPKIQQAMDAVRVIGNNAVHPGQIDLRDTPEVALALFELVNLIVEQMITQPRAVEELYGRLPQGALDQIEKRDS